ncbi:uncharacterized protein [Asterias amurensis]|uniref:uncharacterized protein n=1 Tax=Asterias amurensis TaxID=7602 RepID=UPI003AB395FD
MVSLILALTLAVIFYVLPLNGEMCSTMTSAVDGDNLSALQKRAFSNFRSSCRRESPKHRTTSKRPSFCPQNNTHRFRGRMELQLPMTSPFRLAFTITEDEPYLYLSPSGPGTDNDYYRYRLQDDYVDISYWASGSQVNSRHEHGVNCIGVPVIITYDNVRFEMRTPEYTLTFDTESQNHTSMFVTFAGHVQLNFTEPCINDFDPLFK